MQIFRLSKNWSENCSLLPKVLVGSIWSAKTLNFSGGAAAAMERSLAVDRPTGRKFWGETWGISQVCNLGENPFWKVSLTQPGTAPVSEAPIAKNLQSSNPGSEEIFGGRKFFGPKEEILRPGGPHNFNQFDFSKEEFQKIGKLKEEIMIIYKYISHMIIDIRNYILYNIRLYYITHNHVIY